MQSMYSKQCSHVRTHLNASFLLTAFGDSSVKVRRVPPINPDATVLQDLISWDDDVTEPLLTCKLSTLELLELEVNKMDNIPSFSVHGQSMERCVQAVTRAPKCMGTSDGMAI